MNHVLSIDVGGTKVAVAVVNGSGNILAQTKSPVERSGPRALAHQIAGLAAEALSECGQEKARVKSAGVAVPGIYFAETGNVWLPNLWRQVQVPFQKELQAALQVPVRIDSDRAASVLGEQWLGAGRGVENLVFLAVGTGIGAGIISGGNLLRGAGDIAGAVGWFALNPEFRDSYRELGCWEAEAAGPALARRAGAESAEHVIRAARTGDTAALHAIAENARYLGMGIANLISLFNPEMVLLGGGLMQAHDLFLEIIRAEVLRWAQPVAARQVRIEPARLGDSAALLGAARLALEDPLVQAAKGA